MPQFTSSVTEFRQLVVAFPSTLNEPLIQEKAPHFSLPGFTFVQDLQNALDAFSHGIDLSKNPFLQSPRAKLGLLSTQLGEAQTRITAPLGQFPKDFNSICGFLVADYDGGIMPLFTISTCKKLSLEFTSILLIIN